MEKGYKVTKKQEATEEFTFSTETISIPVEIDGESYELREASGDAACRYRDMIIGNLTLKDGKAEKIAHIAATEPLLVSLCLFKNGSAVSQKTISGWPARIQKKLFKWIKENSDLDEGSDEVGDLVKNGSTDGEPG